MSTLRRQSVSVVLLAIAVAGCTAVPDETELALPEQNVEEWVLPLDAYQERWDDDTLVNYAENELIAACAGDHGYDVQVPWMDVTESSVPANSNAVGRRLFTEDIAAQYGYGGAGGSSPPTPEEALFDEQIYAIDEATWEKCLTSARQTLGITPNVASFTEFAAIEAAEVASQSKEVQAAKQRWYDCMVPVGVPDLPRDPEEMPPQSVRPAEGDVVPKVADAEEIAVATADFACRVSSGYREASYQAEWDAQVEALKENYDDFSRVKDEVEAQRRAIYEAVGLSKDPEPGRDG